MEYIVKYIILIVFCFHNQSFPLEPIFQNEVVFTLLLQRTAWLPPQKRAESRPSDKEGVGNSDCNEITAAFSLVTAGSRKPWWRWFYDHSL